MAKTAIRRRRCRTPPPVRIVRVLVAAGLVACALAACGPETQPSAPPTTGDGWREFEGTWTAAGNRRTHSPRRRSAGLDRRPQRIAAARRAGASRRGFPRRGDRAQRQRHRHGRPRRLDRRARRPGLQRTARRRHGDGQPDRRDLPRAAPALRRRHGQLRVLVAVRARDRGRDRAGPIGRAQGTRARRLAASRAGAGGSAP